MAENAKNSANRETEKETAAHEINGRISLLRQKTQIVDGIFEEIKNSINYNWRTENYDDYIIRYTPEVMLKSLRADIETPIVKMLFAEEGKK